MDLVPAQHFADPSAQSPNARSLYHICCLYGRNTCVQSQKNTSKFEIPKTYFDGIDDTLDLVRKAGP